MAASILSQASCLSAGAELWIVPTLDSNHTSPKLDWYLNFQVSKMERHQSAVLPQALQDILAATELENPLPQKNQSLLKMIPTKGALPCKWVIINENLEFKTWVESSVQTWKSLKQPPVRFFLPAGQTPAKFEEIWKSLGQLDDYSVVID